jgi:hypothetical protein
MLLFLLVGTAGLFAQNFPRVEPEPRAFEYAQRGARAGGYSWTDFAEISLWASGDTGITVNANLEKIRAAANELRASPGLPQAEKDQAEYVLNFMHTKFLRTYSFTQTRVDTLLSNGRYNCVSSAVLYMILAKSIGLDVTGVKTKDHAFAIVRTGGESIDVETTNPYGFDPGHRRDFHDQFGTVTGFAYVPATNYRDRVTISPVELVSLILQNRIADLELRSRFAEAVPLAIDRAVLLGVDLSSVSFGPENAAHDSIFENPRQDMMNRIFNYGASLLKAGKEEDCLRWAGLVMPLYPDSSRWQEFILAATNNRAQKLIRTGQFAAVRELLDSQKPFIDPVEYLRLEAAVIDTEIVNNASKIITAGEGVIILDTIEQARSNKQIEEARAAELIIFTAQKTAAALSAAPARDWLAAINFIETVIVRFGSHSDLDRSLQIYRSNRASDFHNRFASAYNRRNYEEASRIIDEALAEFPDNRQLLADKNLLDF